MRRLRLQKILVRSLMSMVCTFGFDSAVNATKTYSIEDKLFSVAPSDTLCQDENNDTGACDFLVFKEGTVRMLFHGHFEIHTYQQSGNHIVIDMGDESQLGISELHAEVTHNGYAMMLPDGRTFLEEP